MSILSGVCRGYILGNTGSTRTRLCITVTAKSRAVGLKQNASAAFAYTRFVESMTLVLLCLHTYIRTTFCSVNAALVYGGGGGGGGLGVW